MRSTPLTPPARHDARHPRLHASANGIDPLDGHTSLEEPADAKDAHLHDHSEAANEPDESHADVRVHDQVLSRIEALPAELRRQILRSMPDLATLRSVVRASPRLHAQYLHSRDTILRDCLARDMQGYLLDAYAAATSRPSQLGLYRTNEEVDQFLHVYSAWRSGAALHPDLSAVKPELIRRMSSYHLAVARPFTRLFAEWALCNLRAATQPPEEADEGEGTVARAPTAPERSVHDTPPTRTEEIRLFRAFYQCDIFNNLFGMNDGHRDDSYLGSSINDVFFCRLDPWEAEALACIDLFLRDRYNTLFDEVQMDLEPDHLNGIDLIILRDTHLDGTIRKGLGTAVRFLTCNNHEQLVAEAKRSVASDDYWDESMECALWSSAQCSRRENSARFPEANDVAQERRDPMNFEGDVGTAQGPPLAWVRLWGGKYANIYGKLTPEAIKRWGYVVWDESRWHGLGAMDLVAKQWEKEPELVDTIKIIFGWSPVDPEGITSPSAAFRRLQGNGT